VTVQSPQTMLLRALTSEKVYASMCEINPPTDDPLRLILLNLMGSSDLIWPGSI